MKAVPAAHGAEHRLSGQKIRRTEENKGDRNKEQGQCTRDRTAHRQVKMLPALIDDDADGLQQSKDDKRPARTVPDANDEEGHGRREKRMAKANVFKRADDRLIKRDKKSICQRDMPALPKVRKADGTKWLIEVDWNRKIHHPRQAHGHVAVAGKVKIELHHIAEYDLPALPEIETGRIGKAPRDRLDKAVCNDDLLGKTEDEETKPRR